MQHGIVFSMNKWKDKFLNVLPFYLCFAVSLSLLYLFISRDIFVCSKSLKNTVSCRDIICQAMVKHYYILPCMPFTEGKDCVHWEKSLTCYLNLTHEGQVRSVGQSYNLVLTNLQCKPQVMANSLYFDGKPQQIPPWDYLHSRCHHTDEVKSVLWHMYSHLTQFVSTLQHDSVTVMVLVLEGFFTCTDTYVVLLHLLK